MPLKYETDHESLLQRAFAVQYNGKKMKKSETGPRSNVRLLIIERHSRFEKEYQVIRKEEQEEQIEIRVGSSHVLTNRFDDVLFISD